MGINQTIKLVISVLFIYNFSFPVIFWPILTLVIISNQVEFSTFTKLVSKMGTNLKCYFCDCRAVISGESPFFQCCFFIELGMILNPFNSRILIIGGPIIRKWVISAAYFNIYHFWFHNILQESSSII